MKQVVLVTLLTIGALSCGVAEAQVRWYAPQVGYGGYGGYGYGGASTPASAAGHAMADMTRSQGMYNAMTSGAMVNVEEARGKYIENQKQWTDLYLMRQRVVAAEHAQQNQEARARNVQLQEYQVGHTSLPPRLTSSDLDPSTGMINWPSALMRDSFATQRKEIEALFTSRAHTGTTSELSDAIYKQIRAMQDELRTQIRDIVTSEYLEGRKFLDRLSLEGRFPVS